MKCPDCRSNLTVGATFCDCGWRAVDEENQTIFRPCHFSGSGKCRYDHDRSNRSAKPKGALIRINDYWICNWHYEHGYDRVLRSGEIIQPHELEIQSRLFGSKSTAAIEAAAERKAIEQEDA